MMTETQRAAMQAAEDTFRRYAHHHTLKGDMIKAAENLRLADMMAAALVEPEPADTPTGWLYTSAKSLRKKYIAHRDGLPDALRELEPIPLYTRPQRREPLTDDEWLNYLLTHADNSVLHVAADKNNSIRMDGKWYLRADANNLRKLVEKVHGIGAKP